MQLAVTGHRPPRTGLSYSEADRQFLVEFARKSLHPFLPRVTTLFAGGAQGFDMAVMEAALSLNVPVSAAIPFNGHESKWPPATQTYYRSILARCKEVKVFGPSYKKSLFAMRDCWMVDQSAEVLALFSGDSDGDMSGGTALTVKYARTLGRPVTNVWEDWVRALQGRQVGYEEALRDE